VYPEIVRRGVHLDLVTDQAAAHDELNGYISVKLTVHEAAKLRAHDPERYKERSFDSMVDHLQAMLELQKRGSVVFDYGNLHTWTSHRSPPDARSRRHGLPWFRPSAHSTTLLPGQGSFPMGCALG
jgi:urocanate hydratase